MKSSLTPFKKIISSSFILLMIFAGKDSSCWCKNKSKTQLSNSNPGNLGKKQSSSSSQGKKINPLPSPSKTTVVPTASQSSEIPNPANSNLTSSPPVDNIAKQPNVISSPPSSSDNQSVRNNPHRKNKAALSFDADLTLRDESPDLLFELPGLPNRLALLVKNIDIQVKKATLKLPCTLFKESNEKKLEYLIKVMLNDIAKITSLVKGLEIVKEVEIVKHMKDFTKENFHLHSYYIAVMNEINTLFRNEPDQPIRAIMQSYRSCEENKKESLFINVINIIEAINKGEESKILSSMQELIKKMKKYIDSKGFIKVNWLKVENIARNIKKAFTKLQEINLQNSTKVTNFNDSSLKAIVNAISANYTLPDLNLNNIQINNQQIELLAEALKFNYSLTSLNLKNTQIDNFGVKHIAEALKFNYSLTLLELRNNQITDTGAKDIAEALKLNHWLTSLYLTDNQIADKGAKDIAEALKFNHRLINLLLARNQITNEGAKDIVKALKYNDSLEFLDLSQNQIEQEENDDIEKLNQDSLRSKKIELFL